MFNNVSLKITETMKKKSLFAMAAAAVLLAGCTNDSALQNEPLSSANADGEVAVAFNVSAPDANRPRRAPGSEKTGIINSLDDLKADGKQQFGVFGYLTEAGDFSDASKPNFMYNQKVEWDGTNWTYSPVKYWPNEFAATVEAGHTAGTPSDKVSFFAYAPYIATADLPADPSTATGILSITSNDVAGAPVLEYRANTTGTGIDLMWGVARYDYMSRDSKIVDAGFAFKNLIKPTKENEKIPFHFRHALAQFGATIQVYEQSGETFDAANTKVMVEEVELISADGTSSIFNTYGKLSLDNTVANQPLWSEQSGDITNYNYASADINDAIRFNATTPTGTATVYSVQTGAGVTTAKTSLTNSGKGAMFVPGGSHSFKVRVKYHVITKDDPVNGGCAHITNDITSDEISAFTMTAGTTSILNIKLGLREVKFNVSVEAWGVQDDGDQTEVILSDVAPLGPFSVSPTTTVTFSPGNLQATTADYGTTWTWAFAAHQYDCIGNKTANTAITGNKKVYINGTVDLFGWSTAATYYGIHYGTDDSEYSGNFVDWGNNDELIATLGEGWRTLTMTEQTYLLNTRTTPSGVRYAKATITDVTYPGTTTPVTGLIILPDTWKTSYHALTDANTGSAAFTTNEITSTDWENDFEAHGAVFLPAAGRRSGYGPDVNFVGSYAVYWTATPSSGYVYLLFCQKYSVSTYDTLTRFIGLSVRLVR